MIFKLLRILLVITILIAPAISFFYGKELKSEQPSEVPNEKTVVKKNETNFPGYINTGPLSNEVKLTYEPLTLDSNENSPIKEDFLTKLKNIKIGSLSCSTEYSLAGEYLTYSDKNGNLPADIALVNFLNKTNQYLLTQNDEDLRSAIKSIRSCSLPSLDVGDGERPFYLYKVGGGGGGAGPTTYIQYAQADFPSFTLQYSYAYGTCDLLFADDNNNMYVQCLAGDGAGSRAIIKQLNILTSAVTDLYECSSFENTTKCNF